MSENQKNNCQPNIFSSISEMVVIDDRLPEQVSTEGFCGSNGFVWTFSSTTSEMREWKPGFILIFGDENFAGDK